MEKRVVAVFITSLVIGLCLNLPGKVLAGDDTYKIGCVLSLSGPYAILGDPIKKGIELAVEHHGGKVLGKKIELIFEDTEVKAQVAVQKTTKLIAGGVDLLVGAVSSASTLALMPIAKMNKVPHISIVSADERITGERKTRYTFRTSQPFDIEVKRYTFRTSQPFDIEVKMVAEYIKTAGFKSVYGVAADYGVTRLAWSGMKEASGKEGKKIAGESFPALGTSDFSVIINKIADSGADAVAFSLAGRDYLIFVKQLGQQGIRDRVVLFNTTVPDAVQAGVMGPAVYGLLGSTRWHHTMDNQASRKYFEDYQKKYKVPATYVDGDAYDGVRWWLDNVEKTGTFDKEKLVNAFEKSVYKNSIKGMKVMRPCDHQAAQVGLWGEMIKGTGDQMYVFKPTRLFSPEELYKPCP
jgi:branched-chain amino acid transport system substrate-binding protein